MPRGYWAGRKLGVDKEKRKLYAKGNRYWEDMP
jgi:hypothetical protein